MASNPPMEDQTDEDFFDKLEEDDFVGPTESCPKFSEGSDSDDAKVFADLSISDVSNAIQDSVGEGRFNAKDEKGCVDVDPAVLVGAHAEDKNSLVSSNSIGCDSVIESSNEGIGSEFTVDSTAMKSDESSSLGIKEVGWSSFHADSVKIGGHAFGSDSDFFRDLGLDTGNNLGTIGDNLNGEAKIRHGNEEHNASDLSKSVNYGQYQEDQVNGSSEEQITNAQDLSSSQYWENLYPGWKYDPNTGQWYQVEAPDAAADDQRSFGINSTSEYTAVSDTKSEVAYLQQTAQSDGGTVTETCTTESVSNWNQASQESNGYPEHMIIDPQYPGWYYDTISQEWRSLESYNSIESTSQVHDQQTGSHVQSNNSLYGDYGQINNYDSQDVTYQGQDNHWPGSYDNSSQLSLSNWQTESVSNLPFSTYGGNQVLGNSYGSDVLSKDQQKPFSSFGAVPSFQQPSLAHGKVNGIVGVQTFVPSGNYNQQFNPASIKQNEQMPFTNDYYGSQKALTNSQNSFQSGHQSSYATSLGRSSAGRPPHSLVTFGFGGKLIVLKDNSSFGTGNQDPVGGSLLVLNLMEVVTGNTNNSSTRVGACDYFHALGHQCFPGPLVGGSVGNKELNKWIDERIANCRSPGMDYRKGEVLRLLMNLLKISCQHYGKLRSPFGADTALRENDIPESALAELFASAKRKGAQWNQYDALSHCLQKLPSEEQMRATASEVQNLLVSGRKKDALQRAQEGQLWGPALVLASQLGEKFYVDTVKQMALRQLVAGSPLRTLCLLIAGQPREVFSADTTTDDSLPVPVNTVQNPSQFASNSTLDDWEENLAVITANRTKDDELVIIHLGDSLWKEKSEITAAHICYLVAEANFESFSDTARLCLIGADHWKSPRTYASPEAIQRTELYEYSKVLGNSQFILLPFQPYKLIYAHMLAEVGKVSESLKYCQVVLKSLKSGRAPEVETWKQLVLSLEERIRTHQQGGYATNLAPAKLVGKLLNFIDSTASRVVGSMPPPAPATSHGSAQVNEHYHQPLGSRVSTSQSTMAMSSLVPSASMEPINEWKPDGDKMTMHNRSVSEPDFGRTPRQVNSSNAVADGQRKASDSGRASRLSRFGFGSQLLQKTVGLVLRSRPGKQAKLGETNKFYYDEKLKRWVEEGVEPPAEEAALPPPPTTAAFQNGNSDYDLKSALKKETSTTNGSPEFSPTLRENTSGIPPIPPSSNQFSARARMGVRSRYVDTFNQGGSGSTANSFHSSSVPSIKPAVTANAKFFIPTPASREQTMEATIAETSQDTTTSEHPSTLTISNSFQSPPPLSSTPMQTFSTSTIHEFQSPAPSLSSIPMPRFPSMDNIPSEGVMRTDDSSSFSSHSRRTVSWNESFSNAHSPPKIDEVKPLGKALGISPALFNNRPLMGIPKNGGSFEDELHEVEL